MKRVLITGAQGFLGRYLVRALDDSGLEVQLLGLGRSPATDRCFTHRLNWCGRHMPAPLPAELRRPLRPPYAYRQIDIGDRAAMTALVAEFQPNWVFHLASGLRDDDPGALCRTNVEGAAALTQAMHAAGCRPERIVYGSSGSVYGPGHSVPLTEDAATEPCNVYGITKLASEWVTRQLCREYALPAVWARLFNLVGPGQDERHVCGRFAGALVEMQVTVSARRLNVGPLAAERDFIDVRDAARALVALAQSGPSGQACNVASGQPTAIRSVLDTLMQQAGMAGEIEVVESPPRAEEVRTQTADVTRLRALGFTPTVTLPRSLRDLLSYYADDVARASIHPQDEEPH